MWLTLVRPDNVAHAKNNVLYYLNMLLTLQIVTNTKERSLCFHLIKISLRLFELSDFTGIALELVLKESLWGYAGKCMLFVIIHINLLIFRLFYWMHK